MTRNLRAGHHPGVDPSRVTLHCTGLTWGTVDGIRRFHVEQRGWSDIGYHFVITNGFAGRDRPDELGEDGKIWPGRPETVQGAHVRGHNEDNLGVALVGLPGAFTREQFISAIHLVAGLCRRYAIPVERVKGHNEYDHNRACPGLQMDLFRAAVHIAL